MTERKFADEEVIKALEWCIQNSDCEYCEYREKTDKSDICPIRMDALNLINKQNAEIETLKDNNEHLAVMLEEAKSEVERLQEEANRYKRYFFRHDYDEMISEVLDKLDRFIKVNCIQIKDERGIKGYVTSGVHFAIAELKKKYTEGEPIPASEKKYFSPEDVRKMTPQEVKEKYTAIRRSMERW